MSSFDVHIGLMSGTKASPIIVSLIERGYCVQSLGHTNQICVSHENNHVVMMAIRISYDASTAVHGLVSLRDNIKVILREHVVSYYMLLIRNNDSYESVWSLGNFVKKERDCGRCIHEQKRSQNQPELKRRSMDKNVLPCVYEVGENSKGRPTITIRRKSSQIPNHLDLAILRLAGKADMDGLNSIMVYEFLLPEKLPTAEKYLRNSLWKKIEAKDKPYCGAI